MSTTDPRFSVLLEQFTGGLHGANEDIRRQAVDELYTLILDQYADAPSDVVTSVAEQIQEFVLKKLNNPSEINDNRAALLVLLCFVCAGHNFYIELSNKLEPILRGYKQMSVDANLCELIVKLTVILVKGCGRMSIDQFSHDVPKAIEHISQTEKHETRRYSGITILKEIALAAPSRYYHLITPIEEFFEALFGIMTDPKEYIREAFAETMHATLVVLIDRECEEQKMNNNESNIFIKVYNMAYNEVMKCLTIDITKTQNDEQIHGGLLLLNELLRVSDVEFENICQNLIQPYSAFKPKTISYKDIHRARFSIRFERTGLLLPMDIIDNRKQSQIQVQSSLIRSIILENFVDICHQIFPYYQQSNPMIVNILICILPRLASLNCQQFSHLSYTNETMNFLFEHIHSKSTFHALGLMILIDKTNGINHINMTKVFECLQQTFIPISTQQQFLPSKYLSPDSSIFACITMIDETEPDILLEQLLHCGLNHSLILCLEKRCSIPLIHIDTKRKIHQGLLENLCLILSNPLLYNKNLATEQIDLLLITFETLKRFDFEVQAIQPFFIDILNTHFIEHNIVRIRIESIITIIYLLKKLLSITKNKLHNKISSIIQRIVTIGVTDFDPDVRYNVFLILQDDFQEFLAKSEVLELLFLSIHDQCHEIQELVISLLGRLSNINPGFVLPPLRNLLLQLLRDLELGCSLNGKEQSSRLLGRLIANTPRIVRSYMQIITHTLLPLIKQHEQDSNVLIALIRTIGEQAQVRGIDLEQGVHDLFPILINMMQDTSNYRKREVALWTIGQIIENCCYVIEPFQKYPNLLDVLLQFLKSPEEISFHRETIRVLGFLGAIDPYRIHASNDPLLNSNDITSTHRVRSELPSNELLIASNSQSLHDYYTSTSISVCLRILKDSNTPQLHLKAVQSLTKILQWLGNTSTQYISLVLPCLLSAIHYTDDRDLFLYIHQINTIIISIKSSIIDYIDNIVQLIHDYWDRHPDLQKLLIQTIESLSIALDNKFHDYIHLLLPFFMKTFRSDTDINNRQVILSKIFSTLNKFGETLKPHFNTILPSILDIASTNTYPIELRQEALNTIEHLADKIYLSDYVSAVLQILLRIIHKTPELQMKCLDIILIIAQQMGKQFLVFNLLVSKTMDEMKLQHSKYELYISKLKDPSIVDNQIESIVIVSPIKSNGQITKSDDESIYIIRTVQLRTHWSKAMQTNAKDLSMWLNKFQQLLLEQSPIYPLKVLGTYLAQVSPSIPRDLFNTSFISCWSKLNSDDRLSLTDALTYVLSVCDKPDTIQIILNLAEFRNQCDLKLKLEQQQDNERSLINIRLLSEKAFSVRAYAKALRYKEEEFQSGLITPDIIESLISINYELQRPEAARGALEYAKHHNIEIKGFWYEKLNQWERALKQYEFSKTNDSSNMDIHLGCMRCMHALGSWTELKNLASRVWEITESIRDDQSLTSLPFSISSIKKKLPSAGELKKILQQKIAPMATRAAWSLGNMSDMEKYYIHIPSTQFEGAYYRAMNAIRNDNYRQAQDSIDLARELLNVELTTLVNESYNRAYSAMINAQLLSELEEVGYYKTFPERRQSICELWKKRMQGNQPIIDDYHRLLLTHSLCLPMTEDFQSWIKLANLCRRSNRLTMADFIFKQLDHQSNPFIKYEKAKYDWHCLSERQNRGDQLRLIEDLKEMIVNLLPQPEQNFQELVSKCYLRLGTWQYDLFSMTDDDMLTEIMENYKHAWTYDELNFKAWNAYAVLNYDAVNYFKCNQQQILDPSDENSRILATKIMDCTISSVKGLYKSIILSKTKYCLQNTLRLLTLWFEYGHYHKVKDVLNEGIHTIPVEVWLQVLPQLIARIDSPKILVRQLIRQLLIDIARQHPQALIYPLVVASKSLVRERKLAANTVLDSMREHSGTLVQQAMIVSEELIRISILWHEKCYESLGTVEKYFCEGNIKGVNDTLKTLYATIELGSTTSNERAFLDSYGDYLTEAHEHIRSSLQSRDRNELQQARHLYFRILQRIHDQLPNIKSFELDHVSPRLAAHCRNLELAVPGTYEPHKPPITIRNVHTRINVISSKQRPRKISITGSDGYEYVFLLKGHEDLRQDERIMQLLGLVNEFLSANDETRRRNFIIQRYPVIPLAPNSGLLGWIDQCDTFNVLVREYREQTGIILNAEHRSMLDKAPDYEKLPLLNKIEVFEYALSLFDGNDLANILWRKSSSAEIWLDRRSNYIRSLAVMSMVGYILGLGDRHPSNLMLDRASGKVVHIDFGDCFEVAMVREKFAEKVPFRLTRMLRNAMEVTGIDGTFRMTCEDVMDVLRKNGDSLMAVLEAFVHDPLLNWGLLENNNTEQNITKNQPHLSTINEDEIISDGTAQPDRTKRAVEIMKRIREKLTGNDFYREQPIDIPTQVELLIKQATNHENICQCYYGWCPFW